MVVWLLAAERGRHSFAEEASVRLYQPDVLGQVLALRERSPCVPVAQTALPLITQSISDPRNRVTLVAEVEGEVLGRG